MRILIVFGTRAWLFQGGFVSTEEVGRSPSKRNQPLFSLFSSGKKLVRCSEKLVALPPRFAGWACRHLVISGAPFAGRCSVGFCFLMVYLVVARPYSVCSEVSFSPLCFPWPARAGVGSLSRSCRVPFRGFLGIAPPWFRFAGGM